MQTCRVSHQIDFAAELERWGKGIGIAGKNATRRRCCGFLPQESAKGIGIGKSADVTPHRLLLPPPFLLPFSPQPVSPPLPPVALAVLLYVQRKRARLDIVSHR